MKHLIRSFILLILLTSSISSRTFAQNFYNFDPQKELAKKMRAKEVWQDSEYVSTGYEKGVFLSNPLMLNGKPLDYGEFTLASTGELTVHKETVIPTRTMQVPFYVYLRRNGNKVLIPGKEELDSTQTKIDIGEILEYAEQGDQLVIEAVNKEDGHVKRILKLLGPGC